MKRSSVSVFDGLAVFSLLIFISSGGQAVGAPPKQCADLLTALPLGGESVQRFDTLVRAAGVEYVGTPKYLGSGLQNDVFEVEIPQYGGVVIVKLISSLSYNSAIQNDVTDNLIERFAAIHRMQKHLHERLSQVVPKVHSVLVVNGETIGYVSEKAEGEPVRQFLTQVPLEQRDDMESAILRKVVDFNAYLQSLGLEDRDFYAQKNLYEPDNYFVKRSADGSLHVIPVDFGMIMERRK